MPKTDVQQSKEYRAALRESLRDELATLRAINLSIRSGASPTQQFQMAAARNVSLEIIRVTLNALYPSANGGCCERATQRVAKLAGKGAGCGKRG